MSDREINMSKQAALAAPSVGALLVDWLSVPITDWAARAALLFLVLQIVYLIWKWRREARGG